MLGHNSQFENEEKGAFRYGYAVQQNVTSQVMQRAKHVLRIAY